MIARGLIFLFCVIGATYLVLPRLDHWLREQAWMFSDRLRWYGIRSDPRKVFRGLIGASLFIGFVFWLFLGNILFALAAASLACLSPGWIVAGLQANRRRRFAKQFVDVLLLMANSLRAGFNLSQAFQIIANEMPSPTRNEFALLIMDRDLGASTEQALENLGKRMKYESVDIFITAVLVTMQTGGDIARMLDTLVGTIRDRERVEDRVRTMTASGRMQGYVVAALPVLMLAGVFVMSPQTKERLLSNPLGVGVLIFGLILNIIGLLAIRKMSVVKV